MKYLLAVFLSVLLMACSDDNSSYTPNFENKGHELVYELVQKVGNYETLRNKKDVIYTYTYTTPDGKTDISSEQYIFDGELSYGLYTQHERTLPQLKAPMEQGYDGNEFWLKANGQLVEDEAALKKVAFNRPTNFYWFCMFQKLLDPGVNYEHLGEKTIDNKKYDIVKVSFDAVNNEPTDIYQLYINQETNLVDQFLFTVVSYGVVDTPFLMQLEYEEVEKILIPTKRQYKKSTWEAEVTDAPWISVNWSNIQFNNRLNENGFKK